MTTIIPELSAGQLFLSLHNTNAHQMFFSSKQAHYFIYIDRGAQTAASMRLRCAYQHEMLSHQIDLFNEIYLQKLGCDRFNFKYLLNISPAHHIIEKSGV
jgi:hypothetical protein